MTERRVIVVGGGSAGLVAAIAAARAGAPVLLLERMPRVGKKLLATGNGRCNLANARLDLSRFHGADPAFPAAALARFGLPETLRFFAGLGIHPREEEGGKLFPRSGQASAVLDVLRHELETLGVQVRCDAAVRELARRDRGWEVLAGDGEPLRGAAVVLASGGRAAPQLGSNGSGYELARPFGHRLVEPFPALTRIRVRAPFLKHLKGVKVDGRATVPGTAGDAVACGEILFTETGLSGPPILDLSRRAGEVLRAGGRPAVVLDLCPDIPPDRLPGLLAERFSGRPGISAEFALVGFVNKRLIAVLLREAGVQEPAGAAAAVSAGVLRRLAGILAGWRFEVTGTDSWAEAQVTAGGIDVAGVDAATLESRRVPGLFLAGEVLDVDGDCGGFNLQWAWSSGHLAGEGAAARANAAG
jgi:predicted Rossmann fold flavoprotein